MRRVGNGDHPPSPKDIGLVALLTLNPVLNMLDPRQRMNIVHLVERLLQGERRRVGAGYFRTMRIG